MKKSIFLFFAAILCAIGTNAATDLYLRGIGTWDAKGQTKMTASGSTYSLVVYLAKSTTYEFKIADSGWNYNDTYAANNSNENVSLDTEYQTWHDGGKGNMKFTPSADGFYNFSLTSGKLTISHYNPIPTAAPAEVVNGTNVMFYIMGYPDNNFNVLRAKSSHNIDSHSHGICKGVDGYSYVNTAKTNLSTNTYVSNNPGSWNGVENTGIKDAEGGELFKAASTVSTVEAKKATTTTSITGDNLNISTTPNSTTGVLNGSLYIQYYLEGDFIGVTYNSAVATYESIKVENADAKTSTYDISELAYGTYTLKTVLTDGIVYYIADEDQFTKSPNYNLTVTAGKGISIVSGSTDPITLNYTYPITAEVMVGYQFEKWVASPEENGEFTKATEANTNVLVKNGSVTVTASATEILSILTTANSYNVGTPDAAAPAISTNQIGVATHATVAAESISGYTLAGWTLTNCERVDGGAENATTITVKSTGTDAAATVTANYEINKYYVVGSFNGWNPKDVNYEMTYDNGVYKKEVTFAKDVEFKICNGSWDANWGYDNLHGVEYKELTKNNDEDKNIKITAEGTTTFTIVFNLSKHLITFEGLTNSYKYVLMGVNDDWDEGIEFSLNPDATNEYVLKNQIIRSATDAVKVVTFDAEGNKVHENNTVKDGSVPHTLTDEYQNIVLADGVYNFWFNIWDGIYIENSTATPITLNGMNKTLYGKTGWGKKYTALTDNSDNVISIYNAADDYGYGEYQVDAYLADDDITVSGYGTWNVVDGVETLIATLVDEERTVVYNLTATVAAVETYTLTCNDAYYYKPSMIETIFTGDVDGESLKVSIESMEVGENYNIIGTYGETDILAETVTVSMSDLTTYNVTGTFKDAIGNIYNVSIKATPLPKTPVVVENATYTEVDGDIIITGDWNSTALKVILYGYATEDNVVYEEAEMETDDIWAASTEVTLNKTTNAFTITGDFIHGWEAVIYTVTVSGALPVSEPDYTRTVTPGKFGTLCLPFGGTVEGAELFECVGQETGKVYIASVTELQAGVPYIFLATGTELAVYSDGTTAATPGDHNGLHGTFTNDTEVAVGNYILKDNALCQAETTCWVNANRAYLVMSEVPAGAPQQMPGRKYIGMGTKGENAATGLDNITNGENTVIKTIENGQLIIIRNGEKFNAQGVRF
jgi:hypothetical protein